MTDTVPAPTAVSLEPPAQPVGRPAEQPGVMPGQEQKPRPRAQPGRGPNPVLERLFELYPKMFGARFRPLKLGVFQELMALHPDEFKKQDLKLALGLHARSTRYLQSVAAREQRHDLHGVPVEEVAPEHVHHAIMEVFRRRQSRSREDLRPWVRGQLAAAIEASGLTREAYSERVRTQDPLSVALLEEAFAQLAEQAAKREALRRAFEASGAGLEEFARMYGMDPAQVSRMLEHKKPEGDQATAARDGQSAGAPDPLASF